MSRVPGTMMVNSRGRAEPRAGEVWDIYLDPTRGHEQGGNRPAVVVSADWFNLSTENKLVLIVPITTTDKPYPTHILVEAESANLRYESWAMCEQIRAVSYERFKKNRGRLSEETLALIRRTISRIMRE